jgi:hypothetical protein
MVERSTTIAALTLVMGLAGCASGIGEPDDPSDSAEDDRQTLQDYASSFPARAALYGAGIGAAAGCASAIIGDDADIGSCLKRAAVGGAVGTAAGAATGYVIRDRQDRYAVDEIRLQDRLRKAKEEVADARAAGDAAERVAAEHKATIARLESDVARGGASREELERAAGEARQDASRIREARSGLERQVASMDAELADLRQRNIETPAELAHRRDELRQELARLDRQLQALSGVADVAEAQG